MWRYGTRELGATQYSLINNEIRVPQQSRGNGVKNAICQLEKSIRWSEPRECEG